MKPAASRAARLGAALLQLAAGVLPLGASRAQEAPPAAGDTPTVEVVVGVPVPLFDAAAAELRRLPGVAAVQPFDEASIEALAAPVLLVAVPELALARLAARGRLRAPPALAKGLPRRCRDPENRYVLPFAMPYTLAHDEQVVPRESLPTTWERLATSRELHRGLGMVEPARDPVPWFAGMERSRRGSGGEEAGFALWLTLDARIAVYATGHDELLAALGERRIAAAVLPIAVAETARRLQGQPPLAHRQFDEGHPVALLGVAIAAPEGADVAAAAAVAQALLEPAPCAAFAAAVGLESSGEGSTATAAVAEIPAVDLPQAQRWLEHFTLKVRGKGSATEDLADWIDFAFALVFLVFLVFVGLRVRRLEAGRGDQQADRAG